MDRDDLIDTLLAMDEELSLSIHDAVRSQVVLVGGAAFLLRDLTQRKTTHDIDILRADSLAREVISRYPNANSAVLAYEDHIPYNFEDRLVPLDLKTKAIDFFTPSTEDLIVMKLYAERPNDLQDIDAAARQGKVNWNLLDHLVHDPDEALGSTPVPRRYAEMLGAYDRFRERWHR